MLQATQRTNGEERPKIDIEIKSIEEGGPVGLYYGYVASSDEVSFSSSVAGTIKFASEIVVLEAHSDNCEGFWATRKIFGDPGKKIDITFIKNDISRRIGRLMISDQEIPHKGLWFEINGLHASLNVKFQSPGVDIQLVNKSESPSTIMMVSSSRDGRGGRTQSMITLEPGDSTHPFRLEKTTYFSKMRSRPPEMDPVRQSGGTDQVQILIDDDGTGCS